jgi:Protein of unknown function (DUF1553)/Protein of unknown function (DUF1549)/Planctomycete cytochrome C
MSRIFHASVLMVAICQVWAGDVTAKALPSPAARQIDFERDVSPILARCQPCHNAKQAISGLRLDSRVAALTGGASGPVLLPGHSAESRLIQLVAGTGKVVMPPSGERLTAENVAVLRAWIDQGLHWPASFAFASANRKSKADHWSFVPPKRVEPPRIAKGSWARNAIDTFILEKLESEGITPSTEADRYTLIRRLSLDLIGLPPSPKEVYEFIGDQRPDAYEHVVDRLLTSPHYGEKWARHWLDLARYADSDGYEKDLPRPWAWRYRQWVIQAVNSDMPFDEFTIEQIAGDLLPGATAEQKTATGFHRNALTNREGGIDREQLRVEQVVDRTSTVGAVWLGLTVGCAQCHDHKYDPISQKEFYQLSAFFNSVDEADIDAPLPGEMGPYLANQSRCANARRELLKQYDVGPLQTAWEPKAIEAGKHPGKYGGDWDLAWTVLWNDERKILLTDPAKRTQKEQDKLTDHFLEWYSAVISKERYAELKFKELRAKVADLKTSCPALSEAQTIAELPSPRPAFVLIRGDYRSPSVEAQPGAPAVLPPLPASGRANRLTLARWLVQPNNPLTARVAVNRMWQNFFGRGLVVTSEDFGLQGERPSHPQLLDWLATEFISRGWSVKRMHKLIVESATYRQSSVVRKDLEERDPYNILLARQSRLRLEAELVRDAALDASGLLSPVIGGPSVHPPQPTGLTNLGYGDFVKWKESEGADRYRRGLYTFFQRAVPYPQLVNFDAPDSNLTCTRRLRSTTPLQALNLLNDPVFFEAAQALAARVLTERSGGVKERIDYAFELCLARKPSPRESDKVMGYFHRQSEILASEPQAVRKLFPARIEGVDPRTAGTWVAVSRALLNLDEFITRE